MELGLFHDPTFNSLGTLDIFFMVVQRILKILRLLKILLHIHPNHCLPKKIEAQSLLHLREGKGEVI